MKVTTGIDIIEVGRIKDAIEEMEDKFLNKIYTEQEIEYCNNSKLMKYQHFAARFAVKEAVFKAISDYDNLDKEDLWKSIEVINKESGKPVINVEKLKKKMGKTADNLELKDVEISISHIQEYAVASAVAVFEERRQ
mgnify:FL=1